MVLYLLIALGGALGGVARLGISGLATFEKVRVIHYHAIPRRGRAPPATLLRGAAAPPSAPPPS